MIMEWLMWSIWCYRFIGVLDRCVLYILKRDVKKWVIFVVVEYIGVGLDK